MQSLFLTIVVVLLATAVTGFTLSSRPNRFMSRMALDMKLTGTIIVSARYQSLPPVRSSLPDVPFLSPMNTSLGKVKFFDTTKGTDDHDHPALPVSRPSPAPAQ